MKLGNYKDNDVELCRTTNSRVSTHTAEALLEQHIPFTKNSKKIPFFKREIYQGADTLWVITINPRRYGQARRVIEVWIVHTGSIWCYPITRMKL